MMSFFRWRRTTWGLVLWCGYVVVWMAIVGAGVAMAFLWWLTGPIVVGSLWRTTRPTVQPGRAIFGLVVRPARIDRRDARRASTGDALPGESR